MNMMVHRKQTGIDHIRNHKRADIIIKVQKGDEIFVHSPLCGRTFVYFRGFTGVAIE